MSDRLDLIATSVVGALKINKGDTLSIMTVDSDDEIVNIIKSVAENSGANTIYVNNSNFGSPIDYYFDKEFDVRKALRIFGGGLSWGMEYEYATNFHPEVVRGIGMINGGFCYRRNWVTLEYPGVLKANYSGKDIDELTDMMFNAILIDTQALEIKQRPLKNRLKRGKDVHIIGDDVDLKFSIENKKAISCFGKYNIPDGEVFMAPVEETANGWIHFGSLDWGLLQDVTLHFVKGKVVKFKAKNKEMTNWLSKKLTIDAGSGSIGEFAIGTNEEVKYTVGDPLFDEKKYGTFHIALGGSYDSKVQSVRHWDLVKDNTTNYSIIIDDSKILENGKILI